MPRIRYLKPEFFKDEDLAELPIEVRLFFAGMWGLADKAGRLEDRPKRFKAEIFPYDDVDAEQCLQALAQPKHSSGKPFIHRYEVDGQRYIQVLGWAKHQKPHHTEKESEIPPCTPLRYIENGTGKEKQLNASAELNNSSLTVNEPCTDKYLDFVYLTRGEYDSLVARFGKQSCDDRIAELNEAIGSKGYKYKSHYHTILSWDRKNQKQSQVSTNVERPTLARGPDGLTPRERALQAEKGGNNGSER